MIGILSLQPVHAFEGGVGGLGKTKPDTGVVLWEGSAPIQNQQGIVSAELNVDGNPVLVEFTTPWPLLSTSGGLEARDLQSSESAFIQVIPASTTSENQFQQRVLETILGSQGKFGAYGTPTDVKMKKIEDDLYMVTFTAYTPSMRESERCVYLKVWEGAYNSGVVLVTGTTRARFKSQQDSLKKVADSFVAIRAPKSQRNVANYIQQCTTIHKSSSCVGCLESNKCLSRQCADIMLFWLSMSLKKS
jgi:hypothetical protein